MKNKRGIIIAIIVVVLLLCGIITFAVINGKDKDNGNNVTNGSNGNVTEKSGNTTNETDNQTTNTTNNVVPAMSNVEYQKALELVEKAEKDPTSENIASAAKAVDSLNDSRKADLSRRVDEVVNTVAANNLVDEISTLVNDAEENNKKDDIEKARDILSSVKEAISKVADENVRKELEDKLSTLDTVLEDETSPVISGIANGDVTNNSSFNVTVDDDTEVKFTLKEGTPVLQVKSKVYGASSSTLPKTFNSVEEVNAFLDELEDGLYTLVATDKAYNETIVNFTIDRTAPVVKLNNKENKNTYNEIVEIFVEGETSYSIEATTGMLLGKTAKADGNYVVVVEDKAGNKTTVEFAIDMTKPVLNSTTVKGLNGYGPVDGSIYYLEADKKFRTVYRVSEELLTDENGVAGIVTIGGVLTGNLVRTNAYDNDGSLAYAAEFAPTAENIASLTEGIQKVKLSGVTDKFGNKLDVADENNEYIYEKTTGNMQFIYDAAPVIESLTFTGFTPKKVLNDNAYYVKANNKYTVVVRFNEELLENPKISVAGATEVEMAPTKNANEYSYKYTAVNTLTDGTISITISAKDLNGMAMSKDLTTDDNNVSVSYDSTVPTLEITNVSVKDSTSNYIKVGDTLVIKVKSSEKLNQLPKLTVGKSSVRFTSESDTEYVANLTLTSENIMTDGTLKYTISNYSDYAGNTGASLNYKKSETKLTYDGAAPIITNDISIVDNKYKVTIEANESILVDNDAFVKETDKKYVATYDDVMALPGSVVVKDIAGYEVTVNLPVLSLMFNSLEDGSTFTLQDDYVSFETMALNKNLTIDLNGHTITNNSGVTKLFRVNNGYTLTINNSGETVGTLSLDTDEKANYSAVTLYGGKLVLNGGKIVSDMTAVYAAANSNVEINGGELVAGAFAVSGNGTQPNVNINITGGTLTSNSDYAIYLPQAGVTTISGGSVITNGGAGAIAIQTGKLIISGGSFTSNGLTVSGNEEADGTQGHKSAVIDTSAEYGNVDLTITGGTFTANDEDTLLIGSALEDGNPVHDVNVVVVGGTFESPNTDMPVVSVGDANRVNATILNGIVVTSGSQQ